LGLQSSMAAADDTQTAHGEYFVTIGGCNDCHTPGYLFGKPDTSRFLGGSDVGFEIPGQVVFFGVRIYLQERHSCRLLHTKVFHGPTDAIKGPRRPNRSPFSVSCRHD